MGSLGATFEFERRKLQEITPKFAGKSSVREQAQHAVSRWFLKGDARIPGFMDLRTP